MEGQQNKIFIDKLALSAMVVDKEGQLIGAYSKLINRINAAYLKQDRIKYSMDYDKSWCMIFEIYSFMRYNKLKTIEKEKKDDGDIPKLTELMKMYESSKEGVSFKDLKEAYRMTLKFISLSGYHDDTLNRIEIDESPEWD